MKRRRIAWILIGAGSGLIGLVACALMAIAIAFVTSLFWPTSFIFGVRVDSRGWVALAIPIVLVLVGTLLLWRDENVEKSD